MHFPFLKPDMRNSQRKDKQEGEHKVGCSTGRRVTIIKNIASICLKMFPKNFKLLYTFVEKYCRCNQQRMTCNNIFSHEGLDFGNWLEGLLARPKRLLMRRKNQSKEFCCGLISMST
jgi:hypothetical protein